ncbi:MAG: tetratricopeptide repeat protein [Acidobacteriota bacterium]|nr:tetratricopeptide repeat protein [Acidobacteriota bacterium]
MASLAAILVFLSAGLAASQDRAPLLSMARSQLLSGRLADCRRTLDAILLAEPRHTAALKMQSDVYYLSGEDAKAEASLLKALNVEPRNAELHYALGRIYYQESRPEPASEQFNKTIEIDPASYKAWDNLGLCYQALNRDPEAIRAFLKALELVHETHRDYEWPYANLADLLIQKGDYEKAFELAAEASERNPRSARNFYLTGKALVKLNKLDLAIRWLKRATEVDQNYPEAHYLLARIYREKGQVEEGKRELRQFEEARAKTPQHRR